VQLREGENNTTKNKKTILMRRSAGRGERRIKTGGKVEGNKEWEAIVLTTY